MDLAKYLGVTGWVRNLRDGRVEALAEGPKARLDKLVEFCHEGPPGARVSNVTVDWSNFRDEFLGFRITH